MEQGKKICSTQEKIIVSMINQHTKPEMHLHGIHYKYEVNDAKENRFHVFNSSTEGKFKEFKGDLLKTKILDDFKKQIENVTSSTDLDKIKKQIENSSEYKVLQKGQSLMTRALNLETSSIKAFKEMVNEKKGDLELEESFKPKAS